MAVEVKVDRLAKPTPLSVSHQALAVGQIGLDPHSRHVRRRRLARLKQALETVAWVTGSGLLLFIAVVGLAGLH